MIALENDPPPLLRYQGGRTLDQVPAYKSGLQVRFASGERVYVALSDTELAFYFQVGETTSAPASDLAIHYDLEGRLTRVSQPGHYWRRSLSHRILYTRKLSCERGGGLQWEVLHPDNVDSLVDQMQANVAAVPQALESGGGEIEFAKPSEETARAQLCPLLRKAARFDSAEAHRDRDRFRAVYGRVAVLPPDHYNALVLQATQGCSYGACLFCRLYLGVRHEAKTPAEFRKHLLAAVAYHGQAARTRRSIFLGEANAFSLPQKTLVEMFQILNDHFEFPPPDQEHVPAEWWLGHETRFDGVGSFLDVFTGPHRPSEEFKTLRALGLRRLYIGIESGDDALLRWLRKPATADSIAVTVRSIIEAGVHVGVIVLLGAGGEQFYDAHVRQTTNLLSQLPLGRGDFVYFSPLVVPTQSSYAVKAAACGIDILNAQQMRRQEEAIRSGLRFGTSRGAPYLARYELESFAY